MQNDPLFQNPPVNLEALPAIKDASYLKLSPAYWRYAVSTTALTFLFLALPLSIVWATADRWIGATAGAVWFAVLTASLLLTKYQYRIKGYALRRHDIVYRTGLFFRRVTAIPFSRVQHCEIQEGPVERFFRLSTLLVYTAGGSGADLAIPGLPVDEAQRLRDFILNEVNDQTEAAEYDAAQ